MIWIDNQFRSLSATGYAEISVGVSVPLSGQPLSAAARRASFIDRIAVSASEHIVEVQLQLQSMADIHQCVAGPALSETMNRALAEAGVPPEDTRRVQDVIFRVRRLRSCGKQRTFQSTSGSTRQYFVAIHAPVMKHIW